MKVTAMSSDTPGTGRERVLYVLKTMGPQTAARIAKHLGVTTMAVRQHLAVLAGEKLVDFTDDRRKVGRPARLWRLTPDASDRFPERHTELALGMLQAIQSAFGEEGLERLTIERTRQQVQSYRTLMPGPNAPLEERVAALTRLRSADGFMAESRRNRDGTFELVENHCSIAKAANLCSKLCGGELDLFRAVLGADVSVQRTEHIFSGDRRCSFCIAEQSREPASEPSTRVSGTTLTDSMTCVSPHLAGHFGQSKEEALRHSITPGGSYVQDGTPRNFSVVACSAAETRCAQRVSQTGKLWVASSSAAR